MPRYDMQLGLLLFAFCMTSQPLMARVLGAVEEDQQTLSIPDAGQPPAPTIAQKTSESKPNDSKASNSNGSTTLSVESNATSETATRKTEHSAQAKVATVEEVRTLSVSPLTPPLLPVDRPAWVGAPPELDAATHRLFVGSTPVASEEETEPALDGQLVASVGNYIDDHLTHHVGAWVEMGINPGYIRQNLLQPESAYVAELRTSTGPMYQKWVVLEISPEQRAHLVQQYQQALQRKRLAMLGAGLLGLFTVTAVANWGFKRRSRRFASPAYTLPPNTLPLVGQNYGDGQLYPAANHYVAAHPAVVPPVVQQRKRSRGVLAFAIILAMLFAAMGLLVTVRKASSRMPVTATPNTVESLIEVDGRMQPVTSRSSSIDRARLMEDRARENAQRAQERARRVTLELEARMHNCTPNP